MTINTETSSAARRPVRTALESNQAPISMAVTVQEQNMRLVWGVIEQSRRQQEAFWKLAGEPFGVYKSLFGVALPEARAGDKKSPVEDYDRLSVEEMMVERFDRSLV